MFRRQERKYNRRLGLVIILDLEGLCMDHIFPQTVKVYMNLLKLLQVSFLQILIFLTFNLF
jgi:hypothetical protein